MHAYIHQDKGIESNVGVILDKVVEEGLSEKGTI